MSNPLISLLEEEAAAEQQRILQEAQSYAEQNVRAAQEEADRAFSDARAHWQRWSEAELEKETKNLELKRQHKLLQERTRWLDSAKKTALKLLADFRSDPRYPEVLQRLFAELRGNQEEVEIIINPLDQTLLPLVPAKPEHFDDQLPPGLVGHTPDGRIEIRDTLVDRLQKAWPMLLGIAAERLWKE